MPIKQTLLFDDVVYIALDFAKEDGATLLLVTADHETGDFSLTGGELDGSKLKARLDDPAPHCD